MEDWPRAPVFPPDLPGGSVQRPESAAQGADEDAAVGDDGFDPRGNRLVGELADPGHFPRSGWSVGRESDPCRVVMDRWPVAGRREASRVDGQEGDEEAVHSSTIARQ